MPNIPLRFSIVAIVLSISACSPSGQNRFESDLASLAHRTVGGSRDGENARVELNSLIAQHTNEQISGWVCTQMAEIETNNNRCLAKSATSITYLLDIASDSPEKRFYQDTLVFSGEIKKISKDLLAQVEITVSNVKIEKIQK